ATAAATTDASRDRSGAHPDRRPWRDELQGLRQARRQGGGDHGRRQRDRPGGGDRLRARRHGPAHLLPGRGGGRTGDAAAGRGRGPAMRADAGRHRRPGALPRDRRARRRRVRAHRPPRQQRRVPDVARQPGGHARRGVGPDLPGQHHRYVPPVQGGAAPHGAGLGDREHEFSQLRQGPAAASRLFRDQGGDYQLHRQPRAIGRGARRARELRRARPDLDAADPVHDAARKGRKLRAGRAHETARAAARGRAAVRVPSVGRRQLRHRSAICGDRRHAGSL
ncbi:MAG: Dehydrogenases with different specificities (related to short-chain alcohol dehydrogenases), partial [uncultured Sphingomonadaceae bacterium]